MKRRISVIFFIILVVPLAFGLGPIRSNDLKRSPASSGRQLRLDPDYGKLPLAFEPNQGQTDSQVQYLSHGDGYTLFLTPGEAVLALTRSQAVPHSKFSTIKRLMKGGKWTPPSKPVSQMTPVVLRMKLEGTQAGVTFMGLEQLPGISNYFIGKDPTQWHTNIPQYSKVQAQEVYPGVDMVYYGNQRHLEYDFVVKPGADPHFIHLKYEGAPKTAINSQGDLELSTTGGKLLFRAPAIYQEIKGQKRPVQGRYRLEEGNQLGFEVGDYDKTKPLVIDPVLDYSTYLGGSVDDSGYSIAVDSSGNAYVTGDADSTNFPVTGGAFQTANGGNGDVFVTKLNAAGSALVYSTYLGGSALDEAGAIAVDGSGNAYVTGSTNSTNFPTTSGSFQPVFITGIDSFVTKLNPSGNALVYSTYLGGGVATGGSGIAVDGSGNAYVTGETEGDFPTTAGAYQTTYSSGAVGTYVAKLDPTGDFLIYASYLNGNEGVQPLGIAVDPSGNAYVTGYTNSSNLPTTAGAFQTAFGGGTSFFYNFNAFVTKFNPTGSALIYSTYLGGNSEDFARGIALDSSGDAYVAGNTSSSNFPTTAGAFQTVFNTVAYDSFITELNPAGTALVYSTFFGGSQQVVIYGIALDSLANAYVTGEAGPGFPTTAGAYQTVFGGTSPYTSSNAFMSVIQPAGNGSNDLIYSSYLGGSGIDTGEGIKVDAGGNVYLTGATQSTNFPTTSGAYQTVSGGGAANAFVAKFSAVVALPTPTATSTLTPSASPTVTPSFTPVFSPTPALTATPSPTPTITPTPTPLCQTHLWPDPFNPNYAVGGMLNLGCLPAGATVSFYTVSGELVRSLPENGGMVRWNGCNTSGVKVSSGIYFYAILQGSQAVGTGKFLVTNSP